MVNSRVFILSITFDLFAIEISLTQHFCLISFKALLLS